MYQQTSTTNCLSLVLLKSLQELKIEVELINLCSLVLHSDLKNKVLLAICNGSCVSKGLKIFQAALFSIAKLVSIAKLIFFGKQTFT